MSFPFDQGLLNIQPFRSITPGKRIASQDDVLPENAWMMVVTEQHYSLLRWDASTQMAVLEMRVTPQQLWTPTTIHPILLSLLNWLGKVLHFSFPKP